MIDLTNKGRWWLYTDESGDHHQIASEGHPCDAEGGAFPLLTCERSAVIQLDRKGDLSIEEFRDGAWHVVLDAVKETATCAVDRARERRIAKLIDPPGIAFAKQRKGAEARAYAAAVTAATAPNKGAIAKQFPWLKAEAEGRGVTLSSMATIVLNAMDEQEAQMSQIDNAAIAAKSAIRAAGSSTEARAAADQFLDEQ